MSTLLELYKNRKKNNHIETLEDNDIDYVIRKDPIMFSHYYGHIVNSIKQLICHDHTFFGKISKYYFIKEFENRGREYEHILFWIEIAPIYRKDSKLFGQIHNM